MIELTVEGRAFWVRPEQIITIGSNDHGVTLLTIAHLGVLPVQMEVSEVRAKIRTYYSEQVD